MVEATTSSSANNGATTSPESEKPRVQLELQSNKNSSSSSKAYGNGNQDTEQKNNMDLLKQTVAHLKNNHDNESAANGDATEQNQSTQADQNQNANASVGISETSPNETQQFEAEYQELLAKVAELQKGTGHAAEMTCEQRGDAINEMFTSRVIVLLRKINDATIETQIDEHLAYQQTLEYQNRGHKAELIKQKYEQITREYNAQNKQFQERHLEIKSDEQAKREDIVKNFDDHLASIRASMAEDVGKSKEENDKLIVETAELEGKYEELKKECADKTELMNTQMNEQDGKSGNISETLETQIDSQAEELQKQVTQYKEQTALKIEEEKQLLTVLKEYKAKYQEFQQATKFSKQNHKKFAREVQNLGNKKKQLEVEYEALCSELGIQSAPETASELISQKVEFVDGMEEAWEKEKADLLAQTETIKKECADLQLEVKQQKEAAQAAAAAQQ